MADVAGWGFARLVSGSVVALVLLLGFGAVEVASSPPIPPRPTWTLPTPPPPPATPTRPPRPTPPSPSIPESPESPSPSPSLSPRPSASLSSPSPPAASDVVDRPARYGPAPAVSPPARPDPKREAPVRATANSHPNRGEVPASSLYASRSVAQSLIVGGLVGFLLAAIAIALLGWVRRRL